MATANPTVAAGAVHSADEQVSFLVKPDVAAAVADALRGIIGGEANSVDCDASRVRRRA